MKDEGGGYNIQIPKYYVILKVRIKFKKIFLRVRKRLPRFTPKMYVKRKCRITRGTEKL
ncbi:MAG: hypothetical protein CM15mV143_280 [Caudoviricetes sp.]|nr:MAG: hypothetical protein CM15mV143_280 [Caudoviricetes sp.]